MIGSINNECGRNAESKLSNGLGDQNGLESGLDNTAITLENAESAESCIQTIDGEFGGDDLNATEHWAGENINNSGDLAAGSASDNAIKSGAPEERSTVICDRCYLSKRPEPLSIFAGDLCILTEFPIFPFLTVC